MKRHTRRGATERRNGPSGRLSKHPGCLGEHPGRVSGHPGRLGEHPGPVSGHPGRLGVHPARKNGQSGRVFCSRKQMPVVLPSIDHRNEHTVLARETIRLARCAAKRTRRPSYGTMKHILAKFRGCAVSISEIGALLYQACDRKEGRTHGCGRGSSVWVCGLPRR